MLLYDFLDVPTIKASKDICRRQAKGTYVQSADGMLCSLGVSSNCSMLSVKRRSGKRRLLQLEQKHRWPSHLCFALTPFEPVACTILLRPFKISKQMLVAFMGIKDKDNGVAGMLPSCNSKGLLYGGHGRGRGTTRRVSCRKQRSVKRASSQSSKARLQRVW